MFYSRRDFVSLAAGAAAIGATKTTFDFLGLPAHTIEELLQDSQVEKIKRYIADRKEEHIAKVQADLRQPSVSSWNRGVKEMADLMVQHFKALGCQEANLVPTAGFPGVWAYYDAKKPKTIVVYMMYDTQPFDESRWSSPPLEARRVKMDPFPEVIIARGAINSKGPNRYFLNALESIIAVTGTLPVNIMFTCEGEEEQGSPHFHDVLAPYRERLRKANALLSANPSQARDGSVTMSLGNKGIAYFELESHGGRWGRGPQKMPIHSSRKAVLDSPVWRLLDALRGMYDPAQNRILVAGFYDAIRQPNEEEKELMGVLTTRFKDRLFATEMENVKAFANGWTPEEAAWHLTFDTTMNIDGIWGGYTGPGVATILPEKAAVKIDCRMVPNQDVKAHHDLVRAHLDAKGFTDVEMRRMGGGDEWSQTSVKAPVVQAVLAMYRKSNIEPMVWPRSAGSSPQSQYTRDLGLAAGGGGLGHGSRAHADDEYIVTEGNEQVAGIVGSEQSMVDILYAYANWPEGRRTE
ncbi:MAG: M20/M25/M40 family metallo-hydrolase [Gemmatimonadetes bacterium]|nr:M20/M25/M40 family metallo-hydrolase [Gemmatimonadota bacterium]